MPVGLVSPRKGLLSFLFVACSCFRSGDIGAPLPLSVCLEGWRGKVQGCGSVGQKGPLPHSRPVPTHSLFSGILGLRECWASADLANGFGITS